MAKISNTIPMKVKRAKKPTISTQEELTPITQVFTGQYYNVKTRQYHPTTVKFVDNECIRLLEWAELEDSLILVDFIDSRGYNPDTFYDWCKKFPNLEEAHQYAIRRIGSRREYGAMTRKFSESTVHKTLGYYSKVWRDEQVFAAKIREDSTKNQHISLSINEIPWQQGNMAPQLIEAKFEARKTPEEVAGEIHQKTSESRCTGMGSYNFKDKKDK